MIGLLISIGLGAYGKWRWLGYAYLIEVLILGTAGLLRGASDIEFLLIVLIPLGEIALGYGIGALWHRWRRGGWPRDRAIAGMATIRRGLDDDGRETLYWEIETAALTPQIMRILALVLIVLLVLVTVLFGIIRDDFVQAAIMAATGGAGALALVLIVIFGLLFNRLRRVYLLAEDFYCVGLTDPRLFAGVKAAGAVGVADMRPTMMAAALCVAAKRGERHGWNDVSVACYDPRHNRIHIQLNRLGWLGRDRIECHAEGYPAASAWVARHIGCAGKKTNGNGPHREQVEM